MKTLLIKASAHGPFSGYKRARGGAPQSIFALAAATPSGVEFEIVDETIGGVVSFDTDAELAVVAFSTPDAGRGYELADALRAAGKTVVLGGLHASFLPEEAASHADAILIGEVEETWPRLLVDYARGALEKFYRAGAPFDLARLRPFPTSSLAPADYDWTWTVLVSRGCRNQCEFCTVNRFFDGLRYRPVEHVVDEIRRCGTTSIELKADNLTMDREYCLELFRALEPLGIEWSTCAEIGLADDEELLEAAVRSGLSYVLVGIETPSALALRSSGKGFVKPERTKRAVERFHENGVVVDASALFGFDSHDGNIFEETFRFFSEIEVDACDSVILVPFPGTRLFERLEQEGRILTRDWSRYDGAHAVFQPQKLHAEELEYGAYWFNQEWNTPERRAARHARHVETFGRSMADYVGAMVETAEKA